MPLGGSGALLLSFFLAAAVAGADFFDIDLRGASLSAESLSDETCFLPAPNFAARAALTLTGGGLSSSDDASESEANCFFGGGGGGGGFREGGCPEESSESAELLVTDRLGFDWAAGL